MPASPKTISLFAFTLSAALVFGCQSQTAPPVGTTPKPVTKTGTVTIEIRTDEGTETYQIENVASGSTVESVMRQLDEIPVTIHGTGVTAFVESIGETSTSSSEGWTYKVDGEFANRGVGDTTLTPPTTITWSYGDASEVADAAE